MSQVFLARSRNSSIRLHHRINRSRSNPEFVPFSWTLFVLAVFHFSVWSLGVACDPAQGYFTAHTLSLKACGGDQAGPHSPAVQDILIAQQQAEESIRSSSQSLRLIREREAAQSSSVALTQQPALQEGGGSLATQLAQALVFITALQGVGKSSSKDAANNQLIAAALL